MVAMRHRGWLYVSSHACPVNAAGAHTMRMKRVDGSSSAKPKTTFGVSGGGGGDDDNAPAAVIFLVAEVKMHDNGTRVLSVRTRVSIENACGVPVRCGVGAVLCCAVRSVACCLRLLAPGFSSRKHPDC